MKLACNQYYIDSERNPTGGIVGRTPNNERRYVNMAVTGIGTYASYTNSYGNTQNAGNKTGRTYKNAHEYKNYLTQKYECLRSRDYSVNINSSLLSKAMGDEKTKQWLEYNLSLIPKTILKCTLLPLSILAAFATETFPNSKHAANNIVAIFLFFMNNSFLFIVLYFIVF